MQMELDVVGGGLAGCEAAWQAANRGIRVNLFEMRPQKNTEAHQTSFLGELVCSNSLGSKSLGNGSGLLFHEMKILGSLICKIAEETSVPAGSALAVDRSLFAHRLTEIISKHPNIQVIRQEITEIPSSVAIIATGPLTSSPMVKTLQAFHGRKNLFFYDAVAPLITSESIDRSIVFRASRYGKDQSGEGDYLNCPMNKQEYLHFVEELAKAKQIELRPFEQEIESGVQAGKGHFFEGCLPVEILARRGINALAYGPLRPVGLRNVVQGKPPYAIIQLRQDNLSETIYNMVGFQTNLTYHEQNRVFHLIPGLQNAEFVRYGQMHRNIFLFAPDLISETLEAKKQSGLFFAGQIIGVEGYLGNTATGLVAGINAANKINHLQPFPFPRETMIGSLCNFVSHTTEENFQPMKANFGLLPPIMPPIKDKHERKTALAQRAILFTEKFEELIHEPV